MSVSTVQAAPEILPVPSAAPSRSDLASADSTGFSSYLRESSAADSKFSKSRASGLGVSSGSAKAPRAPSEATGAQGGSHEAHHGDDSTAKPAGDSEEAGAGILPTVRAESDLPPKEQALNPADAALDAAAMAAAAILAEAVSSISPVTPRELGLSQGGELEDHSDYATSSSLEAAVHAEVRQSVSLSTLKGVLRGGDGGAVLQSEASQGGFPAAGVAEAKSPIPSAAGTAASETPVSTGDKLVRQTIVAKVISTVKSQPAQPGLTGPIASPTVTNFGSGGQAPVGTLSSLGSTPGAVKSALDPSFDPSVAQAQALTDGLNSGAQPATMDPRVAAGATPDGAAGTQESLGGLVQSNFSANSARSADSLRQGIEGESASPELGLGRISVDAATPEGRKDAQAGFADSGGSQNAGNHRGNNTGPGDMRFAPTPALGQADVTGTQGADFLGGMNESALEQDLDSLLRSQSRDGADAGVPDLVAGNFLSGVTLNQATELSSAKVQAPVQVNRTEVWDAVRESILKVVSENPSHISVELRLDDGSSVGVELRMGASGLQASFRSESNVLLRSLESRWSGFLSSEQADLKVASAVFEGRSSFGSASDSGQNGRELRQQMEDSADAASLSAGQRALATARGSASQSSVSKTDSRASTTSPTLYA